MLHEGFVVGLGVALSLRTGSPSPPVVASLLILYCDGAGKFPVGAFCHSSKEVCHDCSCCVRIGPRNDDRLGGSLSVTSVGDRRSWGNCAQSRGGSMQAGVSDMQCVRKVATGQTWLTLRGISQITNIPEASVSAHLRHLRKEQYGGYTVEKHRNKGSKIWVYRIGGR